MSENEFKPDKSTPVSADQQNTPPEQAKLPFTSYQKAVVVILALLQFTGFFALSIFLLHRVNRMIRVKHSKI